MNGIDYMAYAAQLARVQFQSAANILDVSESVRGDGSTLPAVTWSRPNSGGGHDVNSSAAQSSPLQVHAGLLIAELELAVVRAELRAGTYAPIQERLERE